MALDSGLVGDITGILRDGHRPNSDEMRQEVVLYGRKSSEMGNVLEEELANKCEFVHITDNDPQIPESTDNKTVVLYVDTLEYPNPDVLENARKLSEERDIRLLVISEDDIRISDSYGVEVDHYLS